MIAHTLLCYSLYSRECWEHEWPLGSAGTDLVRCGDRGALLGLKPGQPPRRRPARSGAQLRCRQRAPARGGTWNRSRSYRTRRGIWVRPRAHGGGGRARPSRAPCDGADGRRRGRRAFAAAATALAAPPLSSPWTAPPSPPKQLSSPTPNACPDGKN